MIGPRRGSERGFSANLGVFLLLALPPETVVVEELVLHSDEGSAGIITSVCWKAKMWFESTQ